MAKNGPHEAEMGPKEAKTAQNGPKCPQNDPNLVKGFPYVRPPYHHVFGPPTPGWRRLAATLRLKMAQNGPLEAEMGPNAPKMTPNPRKRFHYINPPYHHVFGPPTPGWRRSATPLLLKMAQNGPLEAEMGQISPKWAQMPPK